jgi:acetyl esterase/lipase
MNNTTISKSLAALLISASIFGLQAQTAPRQPVQGPGGSDYTYQAFTKKGPFLPAGVTGDEFRYYIYQPASPTPVAAPVVLFLHGYNALDPVTYESWLIHLARKGFTVVFPQYQLNNATVIDMPNNAQTSFVDALARMSANPAQFPLPLKDNTGKYKTAYVGHSLGGTLAVVMASLATTANSPLPAPLAVMPVEPSSATFNPLRMAKIPATTKLIAIVGADDSFVCKSGTDSFWSMIGQITQKNLLVAVSDNYGMPRLKADHAFPSAYSDASGSFLNSMDYYGTFKLSVSLLNCAFNGTSCEVAFGNGSQQQVDQGTWSDGTPVKKWAWYRDSASAVVNCTPATRLPTL